MAVALRSADYPTVADPVSAAQKVSPTSRTHGDHVALLDGLRGIAILVVVWYHAWIVTGVQAIATVAGKTWSVQTVATTGFLGVDLFFFISGFCLFYPYARSMFEGRPAPTLGEFFRRRLWKILPSYYLALAAFAALHWSWFASGAGALHDIALHATFIHPWFFDTFGSISGPFWTLGIEVEFYALFPLVCWAFRTWPIPTYAVIVTAAEAYRLWLGAHGWTGTLYQTNQLPAVFDLFASGILTAYLIVLVRARGIAPANRGLFALLSFAALAMLGLLLHDLARVAGADGSPGAYAWLNEHRVLFGLLFSALALGASFGFEWMRRMLSNPLFVFAAAISYNLYLWHLEVIVLAQRVLGQTANGFVYVLGPIAAVAIAALITYAFERPLLRRVTAGAAPRLTLAPRSSTRDEDRQRPPHAPRLFRAADA